MQTAVRRNRRDTSWSEKLASLGVGFAGTLVLMAAMVILLTSDRVVLLADAATQAEEDADLATSCKGDVLLATASRTALCLSPGVTARWRSAATTR
jgi:hypothetical protein